MRPLKLQHIAVFLSLMQTGSTQRAAQQLSTTQPSISKALASLERQLGFPLFSRSSNGLRPTPEAFILLSEADRIKEEITSFQKTASELREGRVGALRVQASPAMSVSVIPHVVTRFKRHWPDTVIQIELGRTEMIQNSLRKNLVDIGLVCYSTEEDLPGIDQLGSADMVCVVGRSHPLAKRSVIRIQDLAGNPVIVYKESTPTGRILERVLVDSGIDLNIAIRVNHSSAICAIVNAGYGVAIVDPYSISSGGYPGLVVRPFIPRRDIFVGAMLSPQRPLSEQGKAFVALTREALEDYAGPPINGR